MTFKPLDVVVLQKELPKHALRTGHVGTVVDGYEPDGLEVEFLSRRVTPRLASNGRSRRSDRRTCSSIRSATEAGAQRRPEHGRWEELTSDEVRSCRPEQ
jgi:hypothetical protein